MTSNDTRCEKFQQAMALGQALSDVEQTHVASCAHCTAVQREFRQLDTLIELATQNLVPQGFADRIMLRLPKSKIFPGSETLLGEKLLAMVTRSRLMQTLLLGLGMVVGITHIVRFFLSIFIASIAAAF